MKRGLLVLLLLALACSREPAEPPPAREAIAPPEPGNLLNLSSGVVPLDRTAELTYENSVLHAIDGTSATYWCSPPEGPGQTMTFALPALTRLARVGATTAAEAQNAPAAVEFEVSKDGQAWTPLTILRVKPSFDAQKAAVSAEARYIRVTTSAPETQTYAVVRSLHAEGQELEPARSGSIDGCWSVDGMPARFEQKGSRVNGVILHPERPIYVSGGLSDRAYLTMWLQAPMWGHAAFTVTPDGKHLSMMLWHEDVVWDHAGVGHLGTRADCASAAFQEAAIVDGLLARAGRYALYGEPTVDVVAHTLARHPSQRFRLVAREFHKGTSERRLSAMRDALRARGVDLDRIEFVDAGRDHAGRSTATELEKRFVGTMELEVIKGR